MTDLKPCPFCGSANVVPEWVVRVSLTYGYVACNNCDCRGPMIDAPDRGIQTDAAITAWNNRPIEDGLRKELAQEYVQNDRHPTSWNLFIDKERYDETL